MAVVIFERIIEWNSIVEDPWKGLEIVDKKKSRIIKQVGIWEQKMQQMIFLHSNNVESVFAFFPVDMPLTTLTRA